MKIMTFSDAKANLKNVMERLVADHEPVLVCRQNAESVVLISLADWRTVEGTVHLLSSPTNRERLLRGIEELGGGLANSHDIVEE